MKIRCVWTEREEIGGEDMGVDLCKHIIGMYQILK